MAGVFVVGEFVTVGDEPDLYRLTKFHGSGQGHLRAVVALKRQPVRIVNMDDVRKAGDAAEAGLKLLAEILIRADSDVFADELRRAAALGVGPWTSEQFRRAGS